ncbi:hypothetical protein [Sphingomonas sp. 10B4]|uniref:hypothetical protein n=1 Tax=Sphingomonas sp. 10B4 TaxID=3048575 RepID=UPI002AB4D5C4|nr:hypothetical protein [Sphingomonas sp. 10B4]MDY7523406.1 hypothetical protein [Sphingomonas sp. 10B4]MEB0281104.1 hypothetical protein [Sphingomonas sp. 10B4]
MTMQQLDPPLPVHLLDKGPGFAFAVIDYGQEHNLIWVTAINETGEIWCAPNPKVRMQANWTMGRKAPPAVVARQNGDCSGDAEPVRAEAIAKPN